MEYPLSFSVTIPDSLQLPASAYLNYPENFGGNVMDEISQLTSDDLMNIAEAVNPPLPEINTEADDEGSSDCQIMVIQPQVQHVVFRFLTKMRALVAKRRMQRGEVVSLSSQLDERLKTRAYVCTFQIAKRESCFTSVSVQLSTGSSNAEQQSFCATGSECACLFVPGSLCFLPFTLQGMFDVGLNTLMPQDIFQTAICIAMCSYEQ